MINRHYQTTDRITFIVRTATPEDRDTVLTLQRAAMDESEEYFVRTREEFDAERARAGDQLIRLLSRDNSLWMVAEKDGEILGSLDFHGGEYERTRHVGHFGMTVATDYRNRGVGTALIEMLLIWARDHPIVEKLTTTFFTTNTRAIALCTRFGFQSEGRRHREYRVRPGRYLDSLLLAKWIK
jgi:RimJ/RimL family protein N-acetyltransferase